MTNERRPGPSDRDGNRDALNSAQSTARRAGRANPDPRERIAVRALQQAMEEALPVYWQRRAATFAAVGTPAADEIALACRRHAALLARDGIPDWIRDEIVSVATEHPDVGQEAA